jgi:phosphoribosylamine--glycine ligase
MRFLLVSTGGDGAGLALRLRLEGHQVKIWVRENETEHRGKGLVDHAEDSDVEHGEIIVADCTGNGTILDNLRQRGALVFGGSSLADKLEGDRGFAEQVMKRCGIRTPEAQSFDNWEEAEQFIRESEDRLVFKPEGALSGNVPSYCPHDNQELLESIPHFKVLCGEAKPDFTLQQFIEGTCISTECFFDGEKFIRPFNHTIERKHLMNGDIGPSGGCTGNLIWLCDDTDPVVRKTVLLLEDFLREHQYIGTIDVNAVVNDEDVYALEFTPRFGWDSLPTYLYSLYTGEFGWLIYQISRGEGPDYQEVEDRFAAGVRVSIPPWPNEKQRAERGVPILGIKPNDLVTKLYPYDVEMRDGKLFTSGGYGIIGVMNGYGDTVEEAFTQAYRKVKKMKVVDLQYRTDLEEVTNKDYRKLERWAKERMNA